MEERSFSILGIGKRSKSGLEAALALKKFKKEVFVSEFGPKEQFLPEIAILERENIPYEIGGHTDLIFKAEVLIVSPGISPRVEVMIEAQKRKARIWSEIELAFRISSAPILAITGTNGKTTTSSLIWHILRSNGIQAYLGGNIGIPLVKIALTAPADSWIVAEVSSFQLENIESFRPKIAVLLNFSPDHLDRYLSLDEYRKAKSNILKNQKAEDWVVRNFNDAWARSLFSPGSSVFFSTENPVSFGAYLESSKLVVNREGKAEPIILREELPLVLKANLENPLAAISSALVLGIHPREIRSSLISFPGVPHRLEEVAVIDGVTYINDSSGTNPLSTARAIEAISSPCILLVGGSEKNANFSILAAACTNKVKACVLFGQTKYRIAQALKEAGYESYYIEEDDLKRVIERARSLAKPGDTILFSPACASFDMFEDFEDRGDKFRFLVRRLAK